MAFDVVALPTCTVRESATHRSVLNVSSNVWLYLSWYVGNVNSLFPTLKQCACVCMLASIKPVRHVNSFRRKSCECNETTPTVPSFLVYLMLY